MCSRKSASPPTAALDDQPSVPVFELATNANDVGGASAGGIVAVVLANIVAIFLVRMIGKNLET